MWFSSSNIKGIIQNSVKHLRWSILEKKLATKIINYFCKTLHLRCLTGFWIEYTYKYDKVGQEVYEGLTLLTFESSLSKNQLDYW